MSSPSVQRMWDEFAAATGTDTDYTAWAFAEELPDLATKLGLLVRDGPKRATAGLYADYDGTGEPLPQVGDYSVIIDGSGEALCIIRTTELTVKPLDDVDEAFAWDEGEGDRTLSWWRDAHIRFFERIGVTIDGSTPMVLERFELVWPVASPVHFDG